MDSISNSVDNEDKKQMEQSSVVKEKRTCELVTTQTIPPPPPLTKNQQLFLAKHSPQTIKLSQPLHTDLNNHLPTPTTTTTCKLNQTTCNKSTTDIGNKTTTPNTPTSLAVLSQPNLNNVTTTCNTSTCTSTSNSSSVGLSSNSHVTSLTKSSNNSQQANKIEDSSLFQRKVTTQLYQQGGKVYRKSRYSGLLPSSSVTTDTSLSPGGGASLKEKRGSDSTTEGGLNRHLLEPFVTTHSSTQDLSSHKSATSSHLQNLTNVIVNSKSLTDLAQSGDAGEQFFAEITSHKFSVSNECNAIVTEEFEKEVLVKQGPQSEVEVYISKIDRSYRLINSTNQRNEEKTNDNIGDNENSDDNNSNNSAEEWSKNGGNSTATTNTVPDRKTSFVPPSLSLILHNQLVSHPTTQTDNKDNTLTNTTQTNNTHTTTVPEQRQLSENQNCTQIEREVKLKDPNCFCDLIQTITSFSTSNYGHGLDEGDRKGPTHGKTDSSSRTNVCCPFCIEKQSLFDESEMAKLKYSFYRLDRSGRPLISSESDRKLLKTIFATLNDSKHYDTSKSPTAEQPTTNNNLDSRSHLSHSFLYNDDNPELTRSPTQSPETDFISTRIFPPTGNKSVSSLQEEDAIGFPPVDDVISDQEDDDVISDVINEASSNDDVTSNQLDFLAMKDVTSLLIMDNGSPSFTLQNSLSTDNLDSPSSPSPVGVSHGNRQTSCSSDDLLSASSHAHTPNSKSNSPTTPDGCGSGTINNRINSGTNFNYHQRPSPNRNNQINYKINTCSVKAGPVDALIAYATQTKCQDLRFYEAFLTTYRTFITVDSLLRKLTYRYKVFHNYALHREASKGEGGNDHDDDEQWNLRTVSKNCLFLMIRIIWEIRSMSEVEQVRRLLVPFQSYLLQFNEVDESNLLSNVIWKRRDAIGNDSVDEYTTTTNTTCTASSSFSSLPISERSGASTKTHNNRPKSILDFKSRVIAEQLTTECSKLFRKIDLPEILAWSKEFREELMPNVVAFTEHWNRLSNWVATLILVEHDRNLREKIFLKFVKVLKYLFEMNNFSSCFAMLCGLTLNSIARLDWPKNALETLSDFSELMSPFHHFKNYRDALNSAKGPCIPHLAIVLHDLQQISVMEDNLADHTISHGNQSATLLALGAGKNVNFSKRWHQYLCLVKLRDSGFSNYGFAENEDVLSYFANFTSALSESELYDLSCKLKPRKAANHF